MKNKIIKTILIILILVGSTYSQKAYFHVYADTSLNNDFVVELSGNMYEGYVGDQTVKLYKKNNKLNWEKNFNRRGLGVPYVSNDGDVALIYEWEKTLFIDTAGNEFYLDSLGENDAFIQHEDPTNKKYHAFSTDGKLFYSLIQNKSSKNRVFVCKTIYGEEIWRYEFDEFIPVQFLRINDNFIFHNLVREEKYNINYCYILDSEGKLIYEYSDYDDRDYYKFGKNIDGYKSLEIIPKDYQFEVVISKHYEFMK